MTEHGSALGGTDNYTKPQVYTLGSLSELTCWEKIAGSADAWQQLQGDGPGKTSGIVPSPH